MNAKIESNLCQKLSRLFPPVPRQDANCKGMILTLICLSIQCKFLQTYPILWICKLIGVPGLGLVTTDSHSNCKLSAGERVFEGTSALRQRVCLVGLKRKDLNGQVGVLTTSRPWSSAGLGPLGPLGPTTICGSRAVLLYEVLGRGSCRDPVEILEAS